MPTQANNTIYRLAKKDCKLKSVLRGRWVSKHKDHIQQVANNCKVQFVENKYGV